jgi:hypothetical protein
VSPLAPHQDGVGWIEIKEEVVVTFLPHVHWVIQTRDAVVDDLETNFGAP